MVEAVGVESRLGFRDALALVPGLAVVAVVAEEWERCLALEVPCVAGNVAEAEAVGAVMLSRCHAY